MFKKLLKNQLVKGSAVLFVGSTIVNLANYLYHLLMGRMLGPVDYGILASLISLIYLLTIPNTTLMLVAVKYVSSFFSKGRLGAISSFYSWLNKKLTIVIFFGVLFLVFSSSRIAHFLHLDSALLVFLVSLFGLISLYASVNLSVLQGFLQFGLISLLGVIQAAVKFFLGILLVFLGMRVLGAALSIITGGLIVLFLSWILVNRFLKDGRKNDVEIKERRILSYALPVFLSTLSFTSLYTTDLVLAKHFLSAQDAGFYASLSMLGKIIFFAASPLVTVMFPVVANYFEKGKNYMKVFNLSFLVTLFLSLGITAVYLAFPKLMVKMLYGESFLPAAKYLPIFALFLAFYSLSYLLVNFYLSIKKTNIVIFPILTALIQVFLICFFHQSLAQLVWVSVSVLGLLLLSLLLYHWLSGGKKKRIIPLSNNSCL